MGISKYSKNPFSPWEKAGMRELKSSIYSPLPKGEEIIRNSQIVFTNQNQ
jgi:hypothetical protein